MDDGGMGGCFESGPAGRTPKISESGDPPYIISVALGGGNMLPYNNSYYYVEHQIIKNILISGDRVVL